MNWLKRTLYAILLGFSCLWFLEDGVLSTDFQFFPWRAAFIQYTGILAIVSMSLAMILALRPMWLEPYFDGMDKIYRLHKWLGISGLVFSVLHFLITNIPKILVGNGVLEQPVKPSVPQSPNVLANFFIENHALAEEFGDWGFKIAVVLIGIALIKRFPYRFFFWTHRLLALLFLGLVFHAVLLMEFTYWTSAIGILTAILMAAGSIAAMVSLVGRVGARSQFVGEVAQIEHSKENDILKVGVRMTDRWPGHKEGQFAFVTFDKSEGAHPFSIASDWKGDGFIAFFIKSLGDYTSQLPKDLQTGQTAVIEGPYGRFDFKGDCPSSDNLGQLSVS